MTRPCKCGLGLRPRRLFGFAVEPGDGAPCFFSGSLALGGCGLPSADRLADCFVARNGKIQGGSVDATVRGSAPLRARPGSASPIKPGRFFMPAGR
mgnify:CR=1 FL=1